MNPVEGEVLIVDRVQGASHHPGFHLEILLSPSWNTKKKFGKKSPCAAFRAEAVASHMGRCITWLSVVFTGILHI